MARVAPLLAACLLIALASAQEPSDSRTIQQRVCPKAGLCPHVKRLLPDIHPHYIHEYTKHGGEPPSLCGNLCTADEHCPDVKKCCPTNCGYACYEPVTLEDNIRPPPTLG